MATEQPVSTAARLWRPVVLVAAAAVGTPTLLALLCALLARQPGMGAGDTVALAGALLGGTYGAPVSFSGMMLSGHLGATPLTLTIATLAATVWVWRRTSRPVADVAEALVGAAGAAVLSSVVTVMLVAVAGSGQVTLGRVSGLTFRGSPGWAFLGSLVMVAVVLLVCVVCRCDWLPGALHPVSEAVRPAAAGVATLVMLLPVVGILTGLAGGLTAGHHAPLHLAGAQARAGAAGAIAYVADLGVWSLVLGAGGRIGVSGFESVLGLASRFLNVDVPGPARLGWEAILLLTAYAVVIGALVLLARRQPAFRRVPQQT